ncbi:MAG TPA: DUF4232 domain-containing protein [Acidimicrobiales bacterium]|nr:MAG: hypothetical protein B7X07_01535 [Actinobacteria bacterium 21-64-8]HQU00087.1 DUF4232 domain-containing protein [Acidimicrobiales bacterium]
MRHARALSWGALASLVLASGVVTPLVNSVAGASTQVPRCVARQITVSVGLGDGAAGTIYFPITFHNKSAVTCRLVGIPVVQPTTGPRFVAVGPAARREVLAGRGGSVKLAKHSGKVTVAFGVAETGNYPAALCGAARFDELRIKFYSGPSFLVHFGHDSTCTKVASTHVTGIIAGTAG